MTPKEFIIWLKGFSKAANPYNVTPAQWDIIVDELYKVEDTETASTNYEPWYNPYQPDFRTTPGTSSIKVDGDVKNYNLNSNTATALRYPQGTSINYTNSQKKKQQLND